MVIFSAWNIISIPPFLLQVISNKIIKYYGDSNEVLISVIQKVKEFDTNLNKNKDREERETVSNLCHHILHWLFLTTKNKTKSTPIVGCSIKEIQKYFKDIQQMIDSFRRPLKMIAASSSTTQDFLYKLT